MPISSIFREKALPSLLISVLVTSTLSGCSKSDGTSSSSDDDHLHTSLETSGRLAFYNEDTNHIEFLNINDQRIVTSFSISGNAPSLYSSPDSRYLLSIQRSENLVSVFDSGIYSEDHGDHQHHYEETPTDTGITFSGTAPTHYSVHEEYGVIFNDAADGQVSSIRLVSDELITDNNGFASLDLDNNMHGVAKLIGNKLFVTRRDLTITDTTLPSEIERYSYDGSNFSLDIKYPTQCPFLHGAGTNESYLVLGCGDGILTIDLTDPNFSEVHTPNPVSIPAGKRIGSIYGHHEAERLVGAAGAHGDPILSLFLISPNEPTVIEPLTLPDNDQAITQGFSSSGSVFYALSQDGQLHFYSTSDWSWISSLALINSSNLSLVYGERPIAVISKSDQNLYVLNPVTQQVDVVDTNSQAFSQSISLTFQATKMAWLGFGADHHH